LGGGDSDLLRDRERRRFGFLLGLYDDECWDDDCWDVEGLAASVLGNLFRFEICNDDSLSGGIALGADNPEVDKADGADFADEGREMTLAAFFCDDVEGVEVMAGPGPR
jgi:hypothetical protein